MTFANATDAINALSGVQPLMMDFSQAKESGGSVGTYTATARAPKAVDLWTEVDAWAELQQALAGSADRALAASDQAWTRDALLADGRAGVTEGALAFQQSVSRLESAADMSLARLQA